MASPIQRLNYHTGLFLEKDEFQLEQNYHMLMRQRINYAVFKPGVLYGMALDYTAGVLKVTAGMAIDETIDPDLGLLGREIVLLADSDPVSLSGFTAASTAWITIEFDSSLDAPKPPTNIASRVTQKVKITARSTNPGPGTGVILLGSIVIGTDSHTDAVQTAVLRLAGAPAPAPTVASFAPASGGGGTVVTITGTNFTGATAVSFGGIAATTFTVVLATQITATVPVGALTGKIRVAGPSGFGESSTNFTVSTTLPVVASFAPATGPIGTAVTITGTNFTGATGVSFGGIAATIFTVNLPTQITATVPVGAVTGRIRVTVPSGFGESSTNFTVSVAAPTVATFAPASGGAGTVVTITGTNFTGATGVSFGGIAATVFTVNLPTQITATVPVGAVTGKIRVTGPGGFGESATNFTVVPAPLFNALNPFTPRSGFVLNPISISGGNFNVDSPTPPQVFFGAIAAVVTTFTATNIQVTVPAGGSGTTVPIRVRTSGGEISSADLIPAVLFNML